jgi:hypothetical protein
VHSGQPELEPTTPRPDLTPPLFIPSKSNPLTLIPQSRARSLARHQDQSNPRAATRSRRRARTGIGARETLEELGSIAWRDSCWPSRARQCRIRPGRRPRPLSPAPGCRRHGASESRGPPMLVGIPAQERAGAAASGGERGCRSGSRRA